MVVLSSLKYRETAHMSNSKSLGHEYVLQL